MIDWVSSSAAAIASARHLDGASLSLLWGMPFAGLLLSIALLPLVAPRFWEHRFGTVAVFWSLVFLSPCAIVFGLPTAAAQVLEVLLLDYLPFILLLFALFVVAGGIRLSGNLVARQPPTQRSSTQRSSPSARCRRAFSALPAHPWC
ncbi:MAG: sodium:proton antiporter [Methyloceanibacter sp.]